MKTFKLPFRIGKKQNRAVLDANGHEIVIFPKDCEYLANQYVNIINENLHGYDNNQTAGDIAIKYKVPIGQIGCPHCGIVCIGAIKSQYCNFCNNNMFEI